MPEPHVYTFNFVCLFAPVISAWLQSGSEAAYMRFRGPGSRLPCKWLPHTDTETGMSSLTKQNAEPQPRLHKGGPAWRTLGSPFLRCAHWWEGRRLAAALFPALLLLTAPGLETANKVKLPLYPLVISYSLRAAFAQALSALTSLRDLMAAPRHWVSFPSLVSVNCLPGSPDVCGSIQSHGSILGFLGERECCQSCLHLLPVRHGL